MNALSIVIILGAILLGISGWVIHLYTLIRSYWSDEKWTVKVMFNYYHEAKAEIIVFTGVIIYLILTIFILL